MKQTSLEKPVKGLFIVIWFLLLLELWVTSILCSGGHYYHREKG